MATRQITVLNCDRCKKKVNKLFYLTMERASGAHSWLMTMISGPNKAEICEDCMCKLNSWFLNRDSAS